MHAELLQLYPTLFGSLGCNPPGSSIHGVFQARTPQWVAICFFRRPSRHRDCTSVSCTSRQSLYHWPPGKPPPLCSLLKFHHHVYLCVLGKYMHINQSKGKLHQENFCFIAVFSRSYLEVCACVLIHFSHEEVKHSQRVKLKHEQGGTCIPIQTIFPTSHWDLWAGGGLPEFLTHTFFTYLCTSHHRLARLVSAVRSMDGMV